MCEECAKDEPTIRLADLNWWRRPIADAIIWLLEQVVPAHQRFEVTIQRVAKNYVEEMLDRKDRQP